jgi:hypothetical protein
MSLKVTPVPPVPEETARVANAAFRKRKGKDSPWIALRGENIRMGFKLMSSYIQAI